MLDNSFGLVMSQRKEWEPSTHVVCNINDFIVDLNKFTQCCNCVILAMTIWFLFLWTLWYLSGVYQVVQIGLKSLWVHNSGGSAFGKNTQSIRCCLSQNAAFFLWESGEDIGESEPFSLKDFITQILDHIIDEENTEFMHDFWLSLLEYTWEDVADEEFGEVDSHWLVGLEKYSNQFWNSNLNFFFLLNFFSDDFLFLFIDFILLSEFWWSLLLFIRAFE